MSDQFRTYFNNLKAAFTNPKNPRYHVYGGAGLTIPPNWIGPGGYAAMCEDLYYDPSVEGGLFKSIQRIDQDGDFTVDNCYLSKYSFVGIPKDRVQEYVDRELYPEDKPQELYDEDEPVPEPAPTDTPTPDDSADATRQVLMDMGVYRPDPQAPDPDETNPFKDIASQFDEPEPEPEPDTTNNTLLNMLAGTEDKP